MELRSGKDAQDCQAYRRQCMPPLVVVQYCGADHETRVIFTLSVWKLMESRCSLLAAAVFAVFSCFSCRVATYFLHFAHEESSFRPSIDAAACLASARLLQRFCSEEKGVCHCHTGASRH